MLHFRLRCPDGFTTLEPGAAECTPRHVGLALQQGATDTSRDDASGLEASPESHMRSRWSVRRLAAFGLLILPLGLGVRVVRTHGQEEL